MLLIIYIYASAYVELLSLMNKKSRYSFKFEIIQMKLLGYMHISDITYPNTSQEDSKLYSTHENQCERLCIL